MNKRKSVLSVLGVLVLLAPGCTPNPALKDCNKPYADTLLQCAKRKRVDPNCVPVYQCGTYVGCIPRNRLQIPESRL